jgi:protein-disulfide isomerase
MKNNKLFKRVIMALILMLTTSALFAKEYSEAEIKTLVKAEVIHLLNSSDGELDSAFAKAIDNFIRSQKQKSERERAERKKEQAKNIRPVDVKRDHIRGNVDAPMTIIEYSDYECPFCKKFHPTVNKLLENNPNKLRWVYRHFPLGFHDPGATKQAEATECVADLSGNEAFWKYSDLIYERTKSNGKGFPLSNLKPLAVEIGVDGDKFELCLNSGKFANKVKEDIENGKKIGVTGTPAAFIINKKGEMEFVGGAMPLDRLQSMVNKLDK